MSERLNELVRSTLSSTRLRSQFEDELWEELMRILRGDEAPATALPNRAARWIVLGTVAGVASATGVAAYWTYKRTHTHRRVA